MDSAQRATECLGLLALFDGIGGGRRALELLGVIPGAFYASEIDRAAMRCVSAAWPQVEHLGAIETITDDVWRAMVNKFPRITIWVVPAGFPCQDLSALNRIACKGDRVSTGLTGRSPMSLRCRGASPKGVGWHGWSPHNSRRAGSGWMPALPSTVRQTSPGCPL